MADIANSVGSSLITSAIQNLSRMLLDEAKLLWGVKAEIKKLCDELKFMDKYLKNSEGKLHGDIAKEVVSQMTEAAQKAEDVIDSYVVNVDKRKNMTMFDKWLHCVGHVSLLHEVNGEIMGIRDQIKAIFENKVKYDTSDFKSREDVIKEEEQDSELLRKRRRDVEEDKVVGLVSDSKAVIEKLRDRNPHLNVVSIVGMGGLGKTTLARKVYKMEEVKGMFQCCAWGYVSNDYRGRDLLMSILQQCSNPPVSLAECEDLNEDQLMGKLRECLKGKKYLIVLDDIWNSGTWDKVKKAFPDDQNGSRILITSRFIEVARYTGPIPPHDLQFLDDQESWELFCKKVFWWGEECPSDLEPLGREMVESCKGLPLAIIVLGGLVSKKGRSVREWSRIMENVDSSLAHENVARDILKLSYDSLPRELKPCFLFLGIYPEDYEIHANELIQFWIAEGFIPPPPPQKTRTSNPEEVADFYLDQLVDRSLVQVATKRTDGGVKTCRIHDLLRDVCISESETNKFSEVSTELGFENCNPRRLSINYKVEFYPETNKYDDRSYTRSLFLFGGEYLKWEPKHVKYIKESFKLARVLHFNQVRLVLPPNGMIHLRHLNVKITAIYSRSSSANIVACIYSLWNLESLNLDWNPERSDEQPDMKDGLELELSKLSKLKRLRHLHIYVSLYHGLKFNIGPKKMAKIDDSHGSSSSSSSSKDHKTIMMMRNLQALSKVALDPKIEFLFRSGFFPNLKKLYLQCDGESLAKCESLSCLSNLHTLNLKLGFKNVDLPYPKNVFPPNLKKLTLENFRVLGPKTVNLIGQLPNLRTLKLVDGELPNSVALAAGEFPALEVLRLKTMRTENTPYYRWAHVKELQKAHKGRWTIEKGGMHCLRRLVFQTCEWIPEELLLLNTIREVWVQGMHPPLFYQYADTFKNNQCKLHIEHQ